MLPPEAQQDEVFDRVAAPVLADALDGFNGTVFAFGQTGSGKTFTINGGTERYGDRGLVPRAISAAFAEAGKRSGHAVTFRVSYMEARRTGRLPALSGGVSRGRLAVQAGQAGWQASGRCTKQSSLCQPSTAPLMLAPLLRPHS